MCCSGFLKIMMFIFNGIISVAGAVILGVGIWLRVDSDSLLKLVDQLDTGEQEEVGTSFSLLANGSYVIIAAGAVLLVIGFLGCCGAVWESRCMLLTFFSIVLIIFLIEVAGAVVLFVFRDVADELFQNLEKQVNRKIKKDYGKEDNPFTIFWNETMEQFQCCGFSNYTDFESSPFLDDNKVYPQPCCNANSTCSEQNAENSNVPGCFNKLLQFISDNAVIIAAVAAGIAALEIAAMVVSMILFCKAGEKRRYR